MVLMSRRSSISRVLCWRHPTTLHLAVMHPSPSSLSLWKESSFGPFSGFRRCPSEVCLSTTVFWNKILGILFSAAKVYSTESKETELWDHLNIALDDHEE